MSSGSQRNPQFLIREAVLTADRWQVPNAPTPDQEQTTNDDAVKVDTTEKKQEGTRPVQIEITSLIAEVLIYESLDKPFLTGKVTVVDSSGLFNGMEFSGTERITLSIGTIDEDHEEMVVRKNFIMTGIEAVKSNNKSSSSSTFVFSIMDEIGFIGRSTKLRKSYSGNLESIIRKIIRNEFGQKIDVSLTGVKNVKDIVSVQGGMNVIVPNLNILETITWLCSRLTTRNSSPYYAFATLNIPIAKSELGLDILDNASISNSSSNDLSKSVIRLGNLQTMLTQSPFNKQPYVFTPSTATKSTERGLNSYFTIKELDIPKGSDTLRMVDMGAVSSNYSNTNLGTGEVTKVRHLMTKSVLSLQRDGTIGSDGQGVQNIVDQQFAIGPENKSKSIDLYPSRNFHTISSSGTYGDLQSYHDEKQEQNFRHKISSKAMKAHLNKQPLNIVIEGSTFMIGRATVGRVIDISVRSDVTQVESTESLNDSRYSGKHLVYELKHQFTKENHNITLNLRKLESKRE
jgi:hypothetical protein